MISPAGRLLLALLLACALPAAAQDLTAGDGKSESASDMLQKLLLGKVKEKSAVPAGTKAALPGTGTAERLPRKSTAGGAARTEAEGPPAKPRTIKPRPARQAELPALPRLKPTAPISASPTIQPAKPTPMPAGSLP